jgi:hypothetical protein
MTVFNCCYFLVDRQPSLICDYGRDRVTEENSTESRQLKGYAQIGHNSSGLLWRLAGDDGKVAVQQASGSYCWVLDSDVLGDLVHRYRAIAMSGLAANIYRRTATANDARRIARRFLRHEDMILRFITRLDLDIFTNNEAEDNPPGQGRPARLRRMLAHPRRPRRLRRRPVLPLYRCQMGHHQDRRPLRALQGQPLDATRHRTRTHRITALPHPRHSKPLTLAE